MKENNNIDDLFREGLQQDFPVDDKLWASLEAELPGSSGISRKGLWIFNLNTIALLMVLCTCAFIPTDNVSTSENKMINMQIQDISDISEFDQANQEELSIEVPVQAPSLSPRENTKKQTYKTHNPTIVEEIVLPIRPANAQASITKKAAINHNQIGTALFRTSIASNESLNQNERETNSLLASIEPMNLGYVPNRLSLSELKLELLSPLNYASNQTGEITPLKAENTYIDIKRRQQRAFQYVELEMMQSLSVSKNLEGSDAELMDYKRNNEQSKSAISYGLNFVNQYKFITYGTGIHYSKYTERVNYTLSREAMGVQLSYDTSYRVVNNGYQSNGVPITLIEEVVNEIRTPVAIQVDDQLIATNTFKRLRVPVFVGLQKRIGNWQAEMRTSIMMNYLVEQEGVYINDDLQTVQELGESNQLNEFILSNKSDISLSYSLFENMAIGTRFSFEQDLNSFTKDYDSKLEQYQLGVWIMWRP